MVWNVFYFRWGTLQMFQNALRMHLNAFKRFKMRCTEKRLNANFVKPVSPKDGHILYIEIGLLPTAWFFRGSKVWERISIR